MSDPVTLKRFHDKYRVNPENGCWEWQASTQFWGYGAFRLGKSVTSSHRAAYRMFKGEIPKGIFVCHKCDNPPCCNPDHLFLGTQKENLKDADSKNRILKGEKCPWAKISDSDYLKIMVDPRPNKEIAKSFNTTAKQVRQLKSGYSRKHLHHLIPEFNRITGEK